MFAAAVVSLSLERCQTPLSFLSGSGLKTGAFRRRRRRGRIPNPGGVHSHARLRAQRKPAPTSHSRKSTILCSLMRRANRASALDKLVKGAKTPVPNRAVALGAVCAPVLSLVFTLAESASLSLLVSNHSTRVTKRDKCDEEPSNKRVRPLGRVTSLANLISPKNGAVRRFGQTIQAIFELSRGEHDLIEDLQLARKAYHDPMLKLSIMSEEELTHIFGNLDAFIPLHEDLLQQLSKATAADGTLPRLNAYRDYCSNQLAAKALLDQKKQDPRVQDFLQRCLESPFSRKLDLWSFLDIPRSRLVKYPLLLKQILRHTAPEHPDTSSLEQAISLIQDVLADIDLKKGESECQYYIDKLEYLDERQRDPRIEQCKSLLCHGELRSKSGTKLHVFLFTEVLVLTRPVSRNERQCFQVYRQPIPVQDLVLEDLQDGDVRMGGSFRGAFSNADKAKNIFRVRSQDPTQAHSSHTLQVNDVFHKQQWLNCLKSAISTFRPPVSPSLSTSSSSSLRRRPSSISAIVHMEEEDENNCPQASQSAPNSPCSQSLTPLPPRRSLPSCSTSSLLKSKKDKKSIYSLGKRKETMV
ncbi:hypothetical protein WMY93_022173 [Mugilogobius chulae]|uniref:Neuroepithelial cell transforming 1 n=1 Tax=Mugilogobius chulae TaxID=88201 RepID=A0AAW0NJV5_9GOBI